MDPVRALEALMDGNDVLSMKKLLPGEKYHCYRKYFSYSRRTFLSLPDGAILANAGHFNVEIDVKELEEISVNKREVRPLVEEYTLGNGKSISSGKGRLVNLTCAEEHPPQLWI